MKAYYTYFLILLFFPRITNCQDVWNDLPSFINGRSFGTSFCIGDKVYFGQGSTGGANITNDFWEFDLSTSSWKTISTIPGNALIAGTAFSYKNYGFVGLGQTGPTTFSKAFYRFNSDSNNWVRIADFPGQARSYATFFVIGNKAFVGCGYNGLQTFNDFYCLNLDSNYWSKISDLPGLSRSGTFHFSINGNGYVLGGGNLTQSSGIIQLKDFFKFDPLQNKWTQLSDFPGENRDNGISFSFDLFGIIALGRSELGFSNEVWEFNSNTNSWINRNSFAKSLRSSAYCFNKNKGFMIGGHNGSNFSSEFIEYTPLSNSLNKENVLNSLIKVYPNPCDDHINIDGINTFSNLELEIFDAKGKCVFRKLNFENQMYFNLESGVYFIKISDNLNNRNLYTKTIIKY